MIPVQKAVTDVQMVTSMLVGELFQKRPCTDFVVMKPVVDDFTGRTMNNLELVCHFTDCHPPIFKNEHTDFNDPLK
jgi:hypothetical protein